MTTGITETTQEKLVEAMEDTEAMKKNSELRIQEHQLYSLITSELGMQMFSVVLLYTYFRKSWILHGITALILAQIADIASSWFLHVHGAQEIGQFRVWLVWWMRIGLNFAKDTAE